MQSALTLSTLSVVPLNYMKEFHITPKINYDSIMCIQKHEFVALYNGLSFREVDTEF